MSKLTPTFADQFAAKVANVVAPHEPLSNGEGAQTVAVNYTSGALQGLPVVPLYPGANVAPVAEIKPLKIALVGTAPSSRMLAPFNDPTWQIWGCSPGNMNVLPRYDAWFEIHSNLLWPECISYGRPYIDWLKTLKCPVYMQERWPSPEGDWTDIKEIVPNATAIPWQDMVKEFGEDFFTSSFAWMMAQAMIKGANEIALFGIDMASRDEYIIQRPGFYFFRHEARRRGIKVTAPNESDIMQSPPLYAISDSTPLGRKILAREAEIKGRIGPMIAERDKLSHNITYLQGALEDLDYFKAIWTGAQKPT